MAIEKNSFKVSRLDSEFSPHSRDTNTMLSSEDEEFQRKNLSAVESDDDDEDDDFDDSDSGAGSDDIDLLEFGQAGEEFCQVDDQTCSIPVELYDLSSLRDVLTMAVWNEVLTEEERFSLTQYLPDMDQENFLRTVIGLLAGYNLHFGNPIDKLFDMLKGGLCEPRVALYRQGLNFFQRRQHYHLLRKYQNTMVSNLCQMKDAWLNCKGYSIEEKLQVLNIARNQKSLMYEKMEELKSESSEMEESGDGLWGKKAKDRKPGQKLLHQSGYGVGSASEFPSLAMQTALEPAKPGKQNKKGALKLGGTKTSMKQELLGGFSSVQSGTVPLYQHNRIVGYDSGAPLRRGEQMIADDNEGESMYEVSVDRDQNVSHAGVSRRTGTFKMGKKHEGLGVEEYTDNFMGLHMNGKNKVVNQLSDIKVSTAKPSNSRISHDFGNDVKNIGNFQQHLADDQMRYGKGRIPNLSLKGTDMETLDVNDPFWVGKEQGGSFSAEKSSKYADWNTRTKKWKSGRDYSELGIINGLGDSEFQSKAMLERGRQRSIQNGGRAVGKYKGVRSFARNDETESDSSEQIDEDEDDNPLMRSKWAYPSGVSGVKSGRDSKKSKLVKNEPKDGIWNLDGSLQQSSRPISDFSEHVRMMKNGIWRAEHKGKLHDIGQIQSSTGGYENYFIGSGQLNGELGWQQIYNVGRNGHIQGSLSGRLHLPAFNAPSFDRRKGEFYGEYEVPRSSFQQDDLEDDDSLLIKSLAGNAKVSARLGKKGQVVGTYAGVRLGRSDGQLIGCNSVTKKRKVKDDESYIDEIENINYLYSDNQLQVEDTDSSKKRGKRKAGDDTDVLEKGVNEVPATGMEVEDVELDIKRHKKPFTLITPTFHTGFSFSLIHLLSTVRMAMITLLPEDSAEAGKPLDQSEGTANVKVQDMGQVSANGNHPNADLDVNKSVASSQPNVPSMTVQEIVDRVKTNPGDPCILETQEPLQDLVRGVLKIFSSKTAPLGAKGWKPLVVYEKTNKSWSWIGPVNHIPSDPEAADEVTSPDAWGLPHNMLVKLVDSFANWLKNGQETLQQIGSLPAPPLTLMQFNLDEKERFKDLKAQKSLTTISPSCEEVRSYFRKEEVLRYSIPDRAFAYTAFDGKKSIVAPLRRCGGKPTSKARDHFMLKRDRPPQVTILCLVRDAAARLPGSIGTRADVCTLIRDSQYIVEDVSDAQVNQVVSGALDRLHYERDPCVQFDGERKLWVYLHREREEEDFEDDGTSSTKKWKRQRKEVNESGDQGTVTVAFPGCGEQTGVDSSSDLNIEPACMDEDKKPEILLYDAPDNVERNADSHDMVQGADHNGPPIPMVWDPIGLNSIPKNKLLCQENSTNEDFDEIFCTDP